MKSTSIQNINYDNTDNAKIIEDALKETEVLDLEKTNIVTKENNEEEYQQSQYPQQQMQQYPQQPMNQELNNFNKNIVLNFQHSFILFIILILFNNTFFKNLLSKIPFTLDIDGNQTFLLYFILFIFIFLIYFLYLSIFN